jgi:hypothetical protein
MGSRPQRIPNLSRSLFGSDDPKVFRSIVLGGALASGGMGKFDDVISPADADAIFAYINDKRWQAYETQESAPGRTPPPPEASRKASF